MVNADRERRPPVRHQAARYVDSQDGSWLFRSLGVGVPISGIGGTILVAFIGAVVLLLLLRILRRSGLSRAT